MTTIRGHLLALVMLGATAGVVHAGDRRVAFPDGWATDPWTSPKAGAPGVIGVVLTQTNPFDGSRLMQIRGDQIRLTPLPGKVVYVRFAPDGQRAVMTVVVPTQGPKVFAVDTEGNILWQRLDSRTFAFSANGTHLLAWQSDLEGPPPDRAAIYDLNGTLIRSVRWERPVQDALLLDSRTVLLGIGHSVLAYNSETGQTAWRHDLRADEPRILQLSSFRPGQVLVTLELGAFAILSAETGAVIYSYSPLTLSAGQPDSVRLFYASFRPFAGLNNDILLFNGSGNGMRVDAAARRIVSHQLPALGPSDYRLNDALLDSNLVFLSRSGVLLRPAQ